MKIRTIHPIFFSETLDDRSGIKEKGKVRVFILVSHTRMAEIKVLRRKKSYLQRESHKSVFAGFSISFIRKYTAILLRGKCVCGKRILIYIFYHDQ